MSLLSAVLQAVAEPARQLGVPGLPQFVLGALVPDRVSGRSAWIADGRAVIAVAGLADGDETFRKRLESALERIPGVLWAASNEPLGRVVVGLDGPELHDSLRQNGAEPNSGSGSNSGSGRTVDAGSARTEDSSVPTLAALVAVVEEVERARPAPTPREVPKRTPPPELAPEQVATASRELALDLMGLAVASIGRVLRVPPAPAELSAVVSFANNVPRIRRIVESALGEGAADTLLTTATAATQALTLGVVGLVVDIASDLAAVSEARANHRAWRAHEGALFSDERTASAALDVPPRTTPLQGGPVERWGDQTPAIAAATLAIGAPGRPSPRPAVATALAAMPKPARLGREGFSTQLGRTLAARGAVTVDSAALRRLDRIGTVVLDDEVLDTGQHMLGQVVPLGGHDPAAVATALHALFRPDALGEQQHSDAEQTGERPTDAPRTPAHPVGQEHEPTWALGPADPTTLGTAEYRRLAAASRGPILQLTHKGRLAALAAVTPEPHPALPALIGAARQAGKRLVIAGNRGIALDAADGRVPNGARLPTVIRALQEDGSGVLLVSANRSALAAADVGVGVAVHGLPAWGADVLIGRRLPLAALLIAATAVADRVSARSVRLSQAALGIAGIASTIGSPAPRHAIGRAMLSVGVASGISLALGAFSAAELTRRPPAALVSAVPWHAIPVSAALERLHSSERGLSATEAQRRQRHLPGTSAPAPVPLPAAIIEELENPLTPILGAGAAVSAAIGAMMDGALVVGATLLSAIIGGVQRRNTDRALDTLLGASAVVARVRRDGAEQQIPAFELVPGDVVLLGPRDVVPADCRVLQAAGLQADESSLTGEPFPVPKTPDPVLADIVAERRSMLFDGTTVAAGTAVAVVVAVGSATEAGRTAVTAHPVPRAGGVQARLAQITRITLPITLAAAVAVIASGMARGRALATTVGAGVSLAVAAVPEGLPFLVDAAQLAAARRLSSKGALVRNPRTIEALGRVTVLGFDKTGTLTEGRIALSAITDARGVPADLADATDDHRAVLAAALRATPPAPRQGTQQLTDRAVTEGARRASVRRTDHAAGWRRRSVLPFEPSRGFHATLGSVGAATILSVKGSPETVLARCTRLQRDGSAQPLSDTDRRRITARIDALAGQGYRMLAVAERRGATAGPLQDDEVDDLVLLGMLALSDPIREAAVDGVARLRDAGVHVLMITGDHPGTAAAIADRLRLGDGPVLTGGELDALDDDALDAVLPTVRVVARSTPAHKVRIVQAFQRIGATVAMTGDGANDAPAIRLADVGIALGGHGAPAARAAADLVVTDDRLETIIAALVEGRSMWGSVRKALGILVGGNLGEVAFTVLAAVMSGVSPLAARQLLLVNLLTDLAPAVAVALRPPDHRSSEAMLREGPEASLGSALTHDVGARAVTTAAGTFAAWGAARVLGLAGAPTVALTALVSTQLAQTIAAGGFSRGVVVSSIGAAAALAAVVQTPAIAGFFGSTPLGLAGWGVTAAAAAIALIVALRRSSIPAALPAPAAPDTVAVPTHERAPHLAIAAA